MIVVLDTNIWIKELALNSGAGAALRFYMHHKKATLGLPEVVRLEVEQNLRTDIAKSIEEMERLHRRLMALFGEMKELVLPTSDKVDQLIAGIFSSVGVQIVDVPLTLDQAHASFLKTIHSFPPSDGKQQFKDGVLWAACVDLLSEGDVHLVTEDRAFFAGRKTENGLAKNLLDEVKVKKHQLRFFSSLTDLLPEFDGEVVVDELLILSYVLENQTGGDELLERKGFSIDGNPTLNTKYFATEDPTSLYVDYSIVIPCVDITSDGRTDARLYIEGNTTISLDPFEVGKLHIGEERVEWVDAAGHVGQNKNVYVSGSVVSGHRTVKHEIRRKLDI